MKGKRFSEEQIIGVVKEADAGLSTKELCRSQRRFCGLLGMWRSSCRYRSKRTDEEQIREKLRELALRHTRWGYRTLETMFRRDGVVINHKRVWRLPRKRPRRGARPRAQKLEAARGLNDGWSMDFVSDALATGRFIDPGKPVQNAFVESFNGKFRDQCLNTQWFLSLEEARQRVEAWRLEYNGVRPHSSLGKLTPDKYAAKLSRDSAAGIA